MAARTRGYGNGSNTNRSFNRTSNITSLDNNQNLVKVEDSIADTYMNDKRDIGHSFMDFAGKLSPITYFEQIIDESNRDMINTGSVNNVAHNNIVYRRIDNFEVKFLDTINIEEESDSDLGQSYTHKGSMQFLPKSVLPKENDYFILKVKDDPEILRLYRITTVSVDTTSFNPGFKVDFILADDGDNFIYDKWVLKDNVKETITYNRAYLGTGFRVLMTYEERSLLNKMMEIYDILNTVFIDNFYDANYNTFFLRDDRFDFTEKEYIGGMSGFTRLLDGKNVGNITREEIFYDPILVEFLISNDLFCRSNINLNVVAPTNIVRPSKTEYHETIFYAVEQRNVNRFNRRYLTKSYVQYESNIHPLSLYKKNMVYHSFDNIDDTGFLHEHLLKIINYYNEEKTDYNSLSEFLSEIIGLYIRGVDYDQKIESLLNDLYEKKNDLTTEVVHPYNKFYLYPMIGFIINAFLEARFSVEN